MQTRRLRALVRSFVTRSRKLRPRVSTSSGAGRRRRVRRYRGGSFRMRTGIQYSSPSSIGAPSVSIARPSSRSTSLSRYIPSAQTVGKVASTGMALLGAYNALRPQGNSSQLLLRAPRSYPLLK